MTDEKLTPGELADWLYSQFAHTPAKDVGPFISLDRAKMWEVETALRRLEESHTLALAQLKSAIQLASDGHDRIAELEIPALKLAELAHELGWRGIANLDIYAMFFRDLFEEFARTQEMQQERIAELEELNTALIIQQPISAQLEQQQTRIAELTSERNNRQSDNDALRTQIVNERNELESRIAELEARCNRERRCVTCKGSGQEYRPGRGEYMQCTACNGKGF